MACFAYIDCILPLFAENFLASFLIASVAVILLRKSKRKQGTKDIEIRAYRRLVKLYSMKCGYIDRRDYGPRLQFIESEIRKNKKLLGAIKRRVK